MDKKLPIGFYNGTYAFCLLYGYLPDKEMVCFY